MKEKTITVLFLIMSMFLLACEREMTGEVSGNISNDNIFEVANVINENSNLGLVFMELADSGGDINTTSPDDVYSKDETSCGSYCGYPYGSDEYRICQIKLMNASRDVLDTQIGDNISYVKEKLEPYGFVRGDDLGNHYFYEHRKANIYIEYYVCEDIIMEITLGIRGETDKINEAPEQEVMEKFLEAVKIINENSDMGFDLWEGVECNQVNLNREFGEDYDMAYPDDVYTEDYSACGTYIEDPVNDELYRICQIWIMRDTRNVLGTQVGDNIDSVDSIMREYDFVIDEKRKTNRSIRYWHKTQSISILYKFGDDGEIFDIYVRGYPESVGVQ